MTDQPERPDTCGTCEFYYESEADRNLQRSTMCRRYPPVPNPIQGPGGQVGNITMWPAVQSTHWCGEWKKSTRIVLQ